MKYIAFWFLWMLAAYATWGQSSADVQSYCNYVEEQGKAQSLALAAPNITAGITPNQGLKPQLFLGLTDSVNNIRKGKLTMEVARKNCDLYKDSVTVQERITYDMQSLERDALDHKLALINDAIKQSDALIEQNARILDAHNIPLQSIYGLQKERLVLEEARQQTSVALAQIYLPALSTESLTELADIQFQSSVANQKSTFDLAKLNLWDLSGQVGAECPLSPVLAPGTPYVGVTFTYNLGSVAAKRHYAAALDAFGDWKQAQVGDVMQSVQAFHVTVGKAADAQYSELNRLRTARRTIEDNLGVARNSDTIAALIFRNQLEADALALDVQIKDTEFRLAALNQYQRGNF